MSPSSRRPIYTNPSAKTWTSPPQEDFSRVLKFHHSLPDFKATPLVPLPDLAKELGVKKIFVKDESNRLGLPAFKILGASWATFRAITQRAKLPLEAELADVARAAQKLGLKLFTATDGNHGRAVAKMAKILGIGAEVFIPRDLDDAAEGFIVAEGANVTRIDGDYDAAVLKADEEGTRQGGVTVQDTAWEGYEEIPRVRGLDDLVVES
jgi:diaminopropionate ammonia-lyase